MMCNILHSYLIKRIISNPEIHSSVHIRKSNFHLLPTLWPSACSPFCTKLQVLSQIRIQLTKTKLYYLLLKSYLHLGHEKTNRRQKVEDEQNIPRCPKFYLHKLRKTPRLFVIYVTETCTINAKG